MIFLCVYNTFRVIYTAKNWLNKLRSKYLVQIVIDDVNEVRDEVLRRVEEFRNAKFRPSWYDVDSLKAWRNFLKLCLMHFNGLSFVFRFFFYYPDNSPGFYVISRHDFKLVLINYVSELGFNAAVCSDQGNKHVLMQVEKITQMYSLIFQTFLCSRILCSYNGKKIDVFMQF